MMRVIPWSFFTRPRFVTTSKAEDTPNVLNLNWKGGTVMERKKPELLLLSAVMLLFGVAGIAFGDWDEGDPNKMHYPQLPKQGGWDVAVFSEGSIWLADDWQCSRTGPVSDIHFWVSWKANNVQPISGFAVRIWSDDPCGPSGWSEPNQLLWEQDFYPGDFTVRDMNDDLQGWFDPYHSEWNQNDHTKWAQVNITDINNPFIQQEGEVYWLMIDMGGAGTIGWKESGSPHFRDDAVYYKSNNWLELRDPLTQDSLDLAFVIDGPNFAKPLASHTKWSQPPIEIDPNSYEPRYCGWDEMSLLMYPPSPHASWTIVADDFRCLGNMPVTSIHWWGSHIGWDGNEPPQSPSSGTEEWRIRFWSNAAADTNVPYSRPKKMLQEIRFPEQRVQVEKAGIDNSPRPQDSDETCFQYYVDLEPNEVFWQNDFNDKTQDDTFWISIEALDLNSVCSYHWGWKTRPWHWMDDAVTLVVDVNTTLGTVVDPCTNQITPIKYQGESFDVSFELNTDPNYIKWEQLYTGIRHWSHYEDEPSMATASEKLKKWEQLPDPNWSGLHCHDSGSDGYYSWITLADDWHCEGGEVTDLHWWGSYENRGSGIDHFHLSIHEPNAQDPCLCLPGPEVWGADVPFSSLTEVDTGMIQATGHTVYLYEYDLDTPFEQVEGQYYWFDITAYAVDPCNPALWYWQENARHFTPILCPAVSGGGPDANWVPLDWPFYGYSDMAFVITSTDEVNEPNDHLVADDWRCLRRTPVTALSWWGSYIGYGYEAGSTGPFMPLPVAPNRFNLRIWTDVSAGADPCYSYSHPGEVIWDYNAVKYDEVLVGYDKYPHGEPNEPVFRYSVKLPEDKWFQQPDYNEVFWLSVQAIYEIADPPYLWGWTNHQHVFNDDAVQGHEDIVSGWVWDELKDQTGASEDMSFMLFTDPNECSNCANYNRDATVNFFDYAEFANEWYWSGPAGGYNNGDLNCDGTVDLYDLDIFCQQWLQYCP